MFGVEGHRPLIAGIDSSVISTFKFTAGLRYDRPRNTQDSLESRNSHPVKRVTIPWKAKSMRLESDNLISPAQPVWEGILLLFQQGASAKSPTCPKQNYALIQGKPAPAAGSCTRSTPLTSL